MRLQESETLESLSLHHQDGANKREDGQGAEGSVSITSMKPWRCVMPDQSPFDCQLIPCPRKPKSRSPIQCRHTDSLKKRSGDVYSRQFMLNVLTMIKPPRRPTDNCPMVPPSASRYVTAHDEQGRAIFKYEGELQYTSVLEKSGRSARFAVSSPP